MFGLCTKVDEDCLALLNSISILFNNYNANMVVYTIGNEKYLAQQTYNHNEMWAVFILKLRVN